MQEVTNVSSERAELLEIVKNINEAEVERLLKIAHAVIETTLYEREKFWNSLEEEELTDEEEIRLEKAMNDPDAEYVPLEEILGNLGYNEDGTKK